MMACAVRLPVVIERGGIAWNDDVPGWFAQTVGWELEPGEVRAIDFSSDWSVGGPFIFRERISLLPVSANNFSGYAASMICGRRKIGENPLIAAIRCKVASVYGDYLPDDIFSVPYHPFLDARKETTMKELAAETAGGGILLLA